MVDENATFEEFSQALEYEWDKLVAYHRVSQDFWRYAEAPKICATLMERHLYDGVTIRLTWPVAQRDMLTYLWPADWWQAFKERWFPAWAKERWPVVHRGVELRELLASRKDSECVKEPLAYSIMERHVWSGR